jgi:hypothetical protein
VQRRRGGCASAADQAADKATLKAAFDQITAEYDKALPAIAQQVEARAKSRLADITAAQRDLGPARTAPRRRATTSASCSPRITKQCSWRRAVVHLVRRTPRSGRPFGFNDRTINFTKID